MMQAWAGYPDGLRATQDEHASIGMFSQLASAPVADEQTSVDALRPGRAEISALAPARGQFIEMRPRP